MRDRSVAVIIPAFQAGDPGSTPGGRSFCQRLLLELSRFWLRNVSRQDFWPIFRFSTCRCVSACTHRHTPTHADTYLANCVYMSPPVCKGTAEVCNAGRWEGPSRGKPVWHRFYIWHRTTFWACWLSWPQEPLSVGAVGGVRGQLLVEEGVHRKRHVFSAKRVGACSGGNSETVQC